MKKREQKPRTEGSKKKSFPDFSSSSLTFVRFKNGLPNGHLNTNTLLICLTCVSVCHSYSGKETFPSLPFFFFFFFSFENGKSDEKMKKVKVKGGKKLWRNEFIRQMRVIWILTSRGMDKFVAVQKREDEEDDDKNWGAGGRRRSLQPISLWMTSPSNDFKLFALAEYFSILIITYSQRFLLKSVAFEPWSSTNFIVKQAEMISLYNMSIE